MTEFLLQMKEEGWRVLRIDPEMSLALIARIDPDDDAVVEYKWLNSDGPNDIMPTRLDRKVVRWICGAFCREQFKL